MIKNMKYPSSFNEMLGTIPDRELVEIIQDVPYFLKDMCTMLSLELQLEKENNIIE